MKKKMTYELLVTMLKEANIDINGEDISDVLKDCSSGNSWKMKNLMTNAVGPVKEITRNKRFIYKPYYGNLCGTYAKHEKKNDVLYIVSAAYDDINCKWVELNRCAIAKTGNKFIMAGQKPLYSASDICGQYVRYGTKRENRNVGLREEFFSFFGGPFYLPRNLFEYGSSKAFNTLGRKTDLANIMEYATYNSRQEIHWRSKEICMINAESESISRATGKIRIPAEAKRMMEKYVRVVYGDCNDAGLETEECCCCFMQNVNGVAMGRYFKPVFDYKFNAADMKFKLYEYKRILFKGDVHKTNTNLMNEVCVWLDDMTGTCFEHTRYVFDMFIDSLKIFLKTGVVSFDGKKNETDPDDCTIWNFLCNFQLQYNISQDYLAYNAVILSKKPIFEKLLKLRTGNEAADKNLFSFVMNNIRFGNQDYYNLFEKDFIDESAKNLNKQIGLPKGMIELLAGKDILRYTKSIQHAFNATPEARSYFLRMNKEECEYFTQMLGEAQEKLWLSDAIIAIKVLNTIYGYKNWKGYLQLLCSLTKKDREEYERFCCVLNSISQKEAVSEEVKKIPWNVKGDEITHAIKKCETIQYMLGPGYITAKCLFENRQKEMQKYFFADGYYIIKPPMLPEELVLEGLEQNHCLSDFVEPVGRGKTTILFLRKADEEDKPFFALEVKEDLDGSFLRQCHGKNNSNMTSDIIPFVERYCKKNNIRFTSGTEMLGI